MRDETLLSRLLGSDGLSRSERSAFLDMQRRRFALSSRQRAWAETVGARVGLSGLSRIAPTDWHPKAKAEPRERPRDPRNLSPQRRGRIEREAEELSREIRQNERRKTIVAIAGEMGLRIR